jgi:hypothetical protein
MTSFLTFALYTVILSEHTASSPVTCKVSKNKSRSTILATNKIVYYDLFLSAAEMMVLALYGSFDNDVFTYPSCNPQDAPDDQWQGYGYYEYDYQDIEVSKQPFQCTDESAIGSDLENFPYYQTVRCVAGKAGAAEDTATSVYESDYFEYPMFDDDAAYQEWVEQERLETLAAQEWNFMSQEERDKQLLERVKEQI